MRPFVSLTNDRGLVHGNALRFEVIADASQPLHIGAPASAQHVDPLHLRNKTHLLVQFALRPPVLRRHHATHAGHLGLFPHCVQVHQRVLELPRKWPKARSFAQCRPALRLTPLALLLLLLAFLLARQLFLALPLLVAVGEPLRCWFDLSRAASGRKNRGGGAGGG